MKKLHRVILTQTHEFVVAADNAGEAREMVMDGERLFYDFRWEDACSDDASTFREGLPVYYGSMLTEDCHVEEMSAEQAALFKDQVFGDDEGGGETAGNHELNDGTEAGKDEANDGSEAGNDEFAGQPKTDEEASHDPS